MQEALIELALRRAGYGSLEEFLSAKGLSGSEAAEVALTPYLLGYDLVRVRAGDTFASVSRQAGSSIRAVELANPGVDSRQLRIGQLLVVPYGFDLVPMDTPMTSQLLRYILRGLQARYPFIRLDVIATTAYGRRVERVRLGSGPRRVYYNAAHHANEWITATMLCQLLEQYARAAAFGEKIQGEDAAKLLRDTTLELVPLVNPDGVDLVNGAATETEVASARNIAEDFPSIPFPEGWKANLKGVDLNLNYPAQWDQAREIKFSQGYNAPAPRDYVGEAPLDQPESRAMFDTTEEFDPELIIAWHTQGQEIYWKFLDMEPPGARALGMEMASASGYQLEDVPYASGFAGYKDWFIQDFNRPGYTIEAGLGENPLPLSQLPDILRDNLPIFLLGLTGGDPSAWERQSPSRETFAEGPAPEETAWG